MAKQQEVPPVFTEENQDYNNGIAIVTPGDGEYALLITSSKMIKDLLPKVHQGSTLAVPCSAGASKEVYFEDPIMQQK